MKTKLLILFFHFLPLVLKSQFDDIYFNPLENKELNNFNNQYSGFDEDLSDYDYYYTARIRRFHRPLIGFTYFDPFYTDMWYYDPSIMMVMSPNINFLLHMNPWSFNRFNFWSPWNHWYGFNNRWNYWYGFNDPWLFGGVGMFNPYIMNWGYGGFVPTFSPVVIRNTDLNKTYYGPRNVNNTYIPRSGENRRIQSSVPISNRTTKSNTTRSTYISSERNIKTTEPSPRKYNYNTTNSVNRQRTTNFGTSTYVQPRKQYNTQESQTIRQEIRTPVNSGRVISAPRTSNGNFNRTRNIP
jgi:hypothetical protein